MHRPGGKFPPALNGLEILVGNLAAQQGRRQDVGGGDGVLDCEIDADAADRGHRVRGIADAQQAGSVPVPQPIDRDGQQLDIGPVAEFTDAVAQIGRQTHDFLAKGRQAGPMNPFEPALRDHERALPVISAIEHHEDAAGVDPAQGLFRIGRAAR